METLDIHIQYMVLNSWTWDCHMTYIYKVNKLEKVDYDDENKIQKQKRRLISQSVSNGGACNWGYINLIARSNNLTNNVFQNEVTALPYLTRESDQNKEGYV